MPVFTGSSKEQIMGKTTKSNKEVKKHALLSPKEKKHAKQVKKHASDTVPIIPHQH